MQIAKTISIGRDLEVCVLRREVNQPKTASGGHFQLASVDIHWIRFWKYRPY